MLHESIAHAAGRLGQGLHVVFVHLPTGAHRVLGSSGLGAQGPYPSYRPASGVSGRFGFMCVSGYEYTVYARCTPSLICRPVCSEDVALKACHKVQATSILRSLGVLNLKFRIQGVGVRRPFGRVGWVWKQPPLFAPAAFSTEDRKPAFAGRK